MRESVTCFLRNISVFFNDNNYWKSFKTINILYRKILN